MTDCPIVPSLGLAPTRLRAVDWQTVVVGHGPVRRAGKWRLQIWKSIVKERRVQESAVGKWKPSGRGLAGRSESEGACLFKRAHRDIERNINRVVAWSAAVGISCQISAQRPQPTL